MFAFAAIETRQVRGAPATDIFLADEPQGIKPRSNTIPAAV